MKKKTFMHNEISRAFEGFWMNLGSASNEIPTEHRDDKKDAQKPTTKSSELSWLKSFLVKPCRTIY